MTKRSLRRGVEVAALALAVVSIVQIPAIALYATGGDGFHTEELGVVLAMVGGMFSGFLSSDVLTPLLSLVLCAGLAATDTREGLPATVVASAVVAAVAAGVIAISAALAAAIRVDPTRPDFLSVAELLAAGLSIATCAVTLWLARLVIAEGRPGGAVETAAEGEGDGDPELAP